MMKQFRIISAILVLCCLLSAFAGCTSEKKAEEEQKKEEEETVYTLFNYAKEDLTPYVEVCAYKNLTVPYTQTIVTEEEAKTEIKSLISDNDLQTHTTDRLTVEGDVVCLDYVGRIDGVAFSGGSSANQQITLKSNSGYIAGFAEGVIGHMPGTTFTVLVTFPENYDNADYAGKAAEFEFTLHYIVESIVTESVAKALSNDTCTTEEELVAYIRSEMEEEANSSAQAEAIWQYLTENATIKDYPQASVDYYYSKLLTQANQYAAYYSLDLETYLSYCGLSLDSLTDYAKSNTASDLVTYGVLKSENIQMTDGEYRTYLHEYVTENYESIKSSVAYEMGAESVTEEDAETFLDTHYALELRMSGDNDRLMNFLLANNTFVPEEAQTEN